MKVVFRADASSQIGTGHVIRCRTLAEELRRRGADVSFITRDHVGHLVETLRQAGFPTTVLPPPNAPLPQGGGLYASWLGVSEATDAKETIAALGNSKADWIVVDHYALSNEWESLVRPCTGQILAIDDLARSHLADIVLDQNYASDPLVRYHNAVPATARRLLGPRFALLQKNYFDLRGSKARGSDNVKRIVIFFGGVDPANMTGLALSALSHADFSDIAVDAVVGAANPNMPEITARVAARSKTTLHVNQPSLAALYAASDLALGAGGGSVWERCCLGVPSLLISIADNQVPASHDLHSAGIARYLGRHDEVTVDVIRDALRNIIADSDARREMSELSRRLVDGMGALRVSEAICPSDALQIMLRHCEESDCAFYFELVNDLAVRQQSFDTKPILWAAHCQWFAAKRRDANCRMMVLEAQGLPMGQIRFDIVGNTASIDYSLDPLVRGRGWGEVLVRLGTQAIFKGGISAVRAEVKLGNTASRAVFERLGFASVPSEDSERSVYVLDQAALLTHNSGPTSPKS